MSAKVVFTNSVMVPLSAASKISVIRIFSTVSISFDEGSVANVEITSPTHIPIYLLRITSSASLTVFAVTIFNISFTSNERLAATKGFETFSSGINCFIASPSEISPNSLDISPTISVATINPKKKANSVSSISFRASLFVLLTPNNAATSNS